MPVFGSRFQRGGVPRSTSRSAKTSSRPSRDALGGGDVRRRGRSRVAGMDPALAAAARQVGAGTARRAEPARALRARLRAAQRAMRDLQPASCSAGGSASSAACASAAGVGAAACCPVPDFEVQKRPQELFVVVSAVDVLVEHAVERRRVVIARASWQPAPAQVIGRESRSSPRSQSVDRHAEAALCAGLAGAAGAAARRAWRRIHFVDRPRTRCVVGQRARRTRPAGGRGTAARSSSDAAIAMRSPRSSRLSGSQLVWSKYRMRRSGARSRHGCRSGLLVAPGRTAAGTSELRAPSAAAAACRREAGAATYGGGSRRGSRRCRRPRARPSRWRAASRARRCSATSAGRAERRIAARHELRQAGERGPAAAARSRGGSVPKCLATCAGRGELAVAVARRSRAEKVSIRVAVARHQRDDRRRVIAAGEQHADRTRRHVQRAPPRRGASMNAATASPPLARTGAVASPSGGVQ